VLERLDPFEITDDPAVSSKSPGADLSVEDSRFDRTIWLARVAAIVEPARP